MLTQERLKELLHYDPDTGLFTNLVQRGVRGTIGAVAGHKHHSGYGRIQIDGKSYLAHRLVWLYVYGKFPEKLIDHVNQVKDDNRVVNLRLATNQENLYNQSKPQTNNTSGFRGVCWYNPYDKWLAQIKIYGKNKNLGYFNTREEASEAYLNAKREHHIFWVEEKGI